MARKRGKGKGPAQTRRASKRISRYSQRRARELAKMMGQENARKALGLSRKQFENWLKGTGRAARSDLRKMNRVLVSAAQALRVFKEQRPGSGRKERIPDFDARMILREAAELSPRQAKDLLQDISYNQREQFYLELASKRHKTARDNRLIVALLLSMGIDPHSPDTYIHAI